MTLWPVIITAVCFGISGTSAADCGTLADPANGSFNAPDGTETGDTATYTCNVGYNLQGTLTTTCDNEGNWSNTVAPTCEIMVCPAVTAPTDGAVDSSNGITHGSSVVYSCNVGYTLVGTATITCDQGAWDSVAPVCQPNDCGTLPDPANGNFNAPDGTETGDTATYTCNVGYNLQGTSTTTCGTDGAWTNTVAPTCQVTVCPAVTAPTDGTVDFSSGITHGSSVDYSCNVGYTLVGTATITCDQGAWDSVAPVCQLNVCQTLVAPTNGAVTLVVASATYTCDSGFALTGSATTLCQSDGTWSNPAPTCDLACPPLTSPENGGVSISGVTATYSCDSGFGISDTRQWICQNSGFWSLSLTPSCSLVCDALSNPDHGSVSVSGAVATYTCDSGFLVTGAASVTCQQDGEWTNPPPTCELACAAQAAPSEGSVTMSADTATFLCNSGYVLSGPNILTCATDGNWNGTAPTCVFACGTLNDPDNGQVIIGTDATSFTCNSGFLLIGSSTIICQTNGEWSDAIPTCDLACAEPTSPGDGQVTRSAAVATFTCIPGYLVNGSDTSVCRTDGNWTEPFPTCELECVAVFAPLYGSMTVSGASHSFSCEVGFLLSGATNIVCQAGGAWTGTVPTCNPNVQYNGVCAQDGACVTTNAVCRSIDFDVTYQCLCAATGKYHNTDSDACLADCGTLPAIANGGVRTDGGTVEGETANYQCNYGYTLIGSSARLCQNDSMWSESDPTCDVGCRDLKPPSNGHVDTSNGLDTGRQAFYNCSSGYNLIGDDTRTCLSTGFWSGYAPTCGIVCPAPASPSHGLVDVAEGQSHGQAAIYRCVSGYALLGDPTRTCQTTGLWDGAEPMCIYAIVPDAMIVFIVLCITLVMVDILIVIFVVYYKWRKRQKNNMGDETEPEQKFDQKEQDRKKSASEDDFGVKHGEDYLRTATPSGVIFNGKAGKVGSPEKPPAKLPAITKNDFVTTGKANEEAPKREPATKSLPYLNKLGENLFESQKKVAVPRAQRRPSRTTARFQDETVPTVSLVTTNQRPVTPYQGPRDDRRGDMNRTGDDRPAKQTDRIWDTRPAEAPNKSTDFEDDPDIEKISLGNPTNPVFVDAETDEEFTDTDTTRRTPVVLKDASTTVKGRLTMAGVQGQEEVTGERMLHADARRRMRDTVYGTLPTSQQTP